MQERSLVAALQTIFQSEQSESKINHRLNNSAFLLKAFEWGTSDVVQAVFNLIQEDNIIFEADEKKRSFCWYAVTRGYENIAEKIIERSERRSKGLPGYQIWFEIDEDGNTLLHQAALKSRVRIASQLIEKMKEANNANGLDAINVDGHTALHLACESGAKEIVEQLIETGANIHTQNNKGEGLLHIALRMNQKEIFAFLIEKISQRPDALILIDHVDVKHSTLFHQAIFYKQKEAVEFLIRVGANLTISNHQNQVPFHFAIHHQQYDIAKVLLDEMGKALEPSELQFYIKQEDVFGQRPLHCACNPFTKEIAEYLLRLGADLRSTSSHHSSPLKIGKMANKEEIIYLARHGAFIGQQLSKKLFNLLVEIAKAEPIILVGALVMGFMERTSIRQWTTLPYAEARQATALFYLLDEEERQHVLEHCKERLTKDPLLKEIKDFYFAVLGTISLKALLTAQCQFGRWSIPLRRINPRNSTKGVPDDILERIPRYAKYVKKQKVILPIISEKQINESSQSHLDQDRLTISSLIIDLETYLTNLRARPTVYNTSRSLYICTVLFWLAFCAIEPWLIYEAVKPEDINQHQNTDTDSQYGTAASIVGTVGFFIVLFSCAVACRWVDNSIGVSNQEWQKILECLRQDVLEKLKALEKREEQETTNNSQQNYLPTDKKNIRELEDQLKVLDQHQSVTQAIAIFSRLKNILEIIQRDMNLTRKPISFFFQPANEVAIEIVEDGKTEEDDEGLEVPLLKQNKYTAYSGN